ncbi:hypothetical protein C5167_018424 [Papaver somniferum]|uniref:Uncharacterized protein n=1 Tax=Papaver somniferum TaxID=3469 RepID=A0A4Y7IRB7_PAPSO|nr:hypothetical protein C5167_018424 [Papaver somniferum]
MSGGRKDDFFDSFCLAPKLSNSLGLEAAVDAATEFLSKAVKLVMVAGPKLRVAKAGKLKPNLDRFSVSASSVFSTAWEIELVVGEQGRMDRLQVVVAAGRDATTSGFGLKLLTFQT